MILVLKPTPAIRNTQGFKQPHSKAGCSVKQRPFRFSSAIFILHCSMSKQQWHSSGLTTNSTEHVPHLHLEIYRFLFCNERVLVFMHKRRGFTMHELVVPSKTALPAVVAQLPFAKPLSLEFESPYVSSSQLALLPCECSLSEVSELSEDIVET